MVSCKESLETLIQWLKQGKPDAETLVDFPWEVERVSELNIRAVHPRFPVGIDIVCSDEARSVRVIILTKFETISLDNKARIKLYRKLLRLNNMPLTKFILYGDDDSIGVAVDLSMHSLGKKEFNDALAFLLGALVTVVKEIGVEEELYKSMAKELARLVSKHFEEGWSRERLVKYLVEVVGMNPQDAEEFLDTIGLKAADIISKIRGTISM